MAPFALVEILGKPLAYLIYLAIGLAFGSVLEMAGFADSRRLAAQFYLKNMTVLKVMFTAIITAMVLIFLSSAVGILDYKRLWVNPTYLLPGVVGGLIMGVGFILGGFCPGTSLVAVANLKIDGIFFFLGVCVGVFLFGETVGLYRTFWHSTDMGRFTLPDWLGIPTGWVVLLVVCMALFMFWGAERLEAIFGGTGRSKRRRLPVGKIIGAGALLLLSVIVLGIGQPTSSDRWERLVREKQPLLDSREVYIHPGELVDLSQNDQINLLLLDVRNEADFNQFHIIDSERVSLDEIREGLISLRLLSAPQNTVIILTSNNEHRSTEAWKLLVSDGVLNVYTLEGGINNWLDIFKHEGCGPLCRVAVELSEGSISDSLRHVFEHALGSAQPTADPDALTEFELDFTPKVKLQTRKTLGGGCG
jgi:rhodanese-related sulfurtransferase